MNVAIFGKSFLPGFHPFVKQLFKELQSIEAIISVYQPFYDYIINEVEYKPKINSCFTNPAEVTKDIDFLISIGGDGTFLESVHFVQDKNIPIIGINSGRLGFMADIAKEEICEALNAIKNKHYIIEKRTLLEVDTAGKLFSDFNYGLNELTVHKRDSSSMITIHAYINGNLLNSYWADGLIVATPTGSTAYSMSVGGPIVLPDACNFIITPIASHNLTVRPIVIPDNKELLLKIGGRSGNFIVSLDSRSEVIDKNIEIIIRKAPFSLNVLKLKNHNFFKTLQNKLLWGIDKRN